VIVSCEITPGNFADVKQAPRLLLRAGANFNMKEVSMDKAYSSKLVHRIIYSLGAMPYIPFKHNSKTPDENSTELWDRLFLYFRNHREEFDEHYHKRSNVETTFSMIKLRFGEHLKSKNYTAQRNELVMKFICHNICCLIQEIYENNIKIDFREADLKFMEPEIPAEYLTRDGSNIDDKEF
jgi:transposase